MTSQTPEHDISSESDEALAALARTGDQRAVTKLIDRYRPLVSVIASRYFSASLEKDDIVQEGLIGLLSAVYSYSPGKGATFRTYCAVCAANAIRSAVKAETGKKHSPLNTSVPLEDADITGDLSPEQIVLSDERAGYIDRVISTKLSPLEKAVLKRHLNGEDYKTAAAALGITEKAVDNALQRARGKLSKALRDY